MIKMNVRGVVLKSLLFIGILALGIVAGVFLTLQYQEDQMKMKIFAYNIAAQQYLKDGKLDEAAVAAAGAIVLRPEAYSAYSTLADIYAKQGRVASARWAYMIALAKVDQGGSMYIVLTDERKAHERAIINSKIQALH